MTDNTVDTWQEIKNGLGSFFKILFYSAIGLGIFAGAGYVYFNCFN